MKTRTKIIGLTMSALLLVTATFFGTMAYLTDSKEVVNTFTVGNVQIKLDEAKANLDGTLIEDAARVEANSYKLLPGHEYNKDPMVTVIVGSEESYIRMMVTISNSRELDAIFAPTGADLIEIFDGYDKNEWTLVNPTGTRNDDNTITYEFRYKDTVDATTATADVELDALFDKIIVPGSIDNEQLATLADMTITVNAHAIQADGFVDATAAWTAFDAE